MGYKGKIKVKVKMQVSPTDVYAINRMVSAIIRSCDEGPDQDGVFKVAGIGIGIGSMLYTAELLKGISHAVDMKTDEMSDACNDFFGCERMTQEEEMKYDKHKNADDN